MDWTEDKMTFGDGNVLLRRAGSGAPLLILHEELGDLGPLRWQAELAGSRTVLHPYHPGFAKAPRVEWIASVRDLAGYYAGWLRNRSLAPIDVVGVSFGGWIAAEMMAADPALFRRVVLVSPLGIRPQPGEIFDLFQVKTPQYIAQSVASPASTEEYAGLVANAEAPEQFEAWEDAKAEVARLAWEPYMFNTSLPSLLGLSSMPMTLIVGGRQDGIVPVSALETYARAIGGAELLVYERCGHRPEIELRDRFVQDVKKFLA
ncbi:MAG: alpha/beta hydrolase [Nevskia sp.]|nr:alpha/beta hydrolase [Nevskia sp.]